MKRNYFILLLIALFVSQNSLYTEVNAFSYSFIDVHMHLDSSNTDSTNTEKRFRKINKKEPDSLTPKERRQLIQKNRQRMQANDSNKSNSNRNFIPSADELVKVMERRSVAISIVMPPPQETGQKAFYDYKSLLPVIDAHPNRLMLGAGGGTLNPIILATPSSKVTEALKKEFRSIANNLIEAGAIVFGEMAAMHLCMNPKHHYSAAPPDHPLFMLLADIAAENNIPIDLHMEAVKKDISVNNRIANACDKNPEIIPATIKRFERLLEHNRNAKIVWQHIGWDNTGEMTPDLMNRLLHNHSNLYLAIKSTGKAEGKRPNTISETDGSIDADWLSLFYTFPERIIVGADEFTRAKGSGGYKKPPFFEDTWSMINTLPDKLIQKIGHDNAARIYGI